MAYRVLKPLFEVVLAIVDGQQSRQILPQVALYHFTINELGDPLAQGIGAIFNEFPRGVHL